VPLARYSFTGRVLSELAGALAVVHVVLLGIGGALIDASWPSGLEFLPWLAMALIVVVPLDEKVHVLAATRLGYDPSVKIDLPKIFTTCSESLSRNHVIVVALSPLVALNTLAFTLFWFGPLQLFAALCIVVNTVGSAGDLWLASNLFRHERDARVLATDAGVEVWPGGVKLAVE